MLLYEDGFIEILGDNDTVYLKTLKEGFPIKKFDKILQGNEKSSYLTNVTNGKFFIEFGELNV